MYTAKDRGRARVETYGAPPPARLTVSLRRGALEPPAFVPPPYPHDRLGPIRATAAAVPGGILDASVGTPVDPMPAVVLDALAAGRARRHRLPGHHRQPGVPRGRGGLGRPPLRLLGHRRRRDRVHRHQGSGGVAAADAVAARPVARHRAVPRGGVPHLRDGRAARRPARGAGAGRRRVAPRPRPRRSRRRRPRAPALAQRPEQPDRRGGDARRGCSTRSSGRGRGGSSSPATSATPSSPTTPTVRPPRRSPRSTPGPTACSWSTRCRSARTWPGCGPGSSPATARWSATSARCASTAG